MLNHFSVRRGLLAALRSAGCILLTLAAAGAVASTVVKQELSDPAARCNDGRPAAFYYDVTGSNNWIIYLAGGQGCLTQEICNVSWERSARAAGLVPGKTVSDVNNMIGGPYLPCEKGSKKTGCTVTNDGLFDRTRADNPVRDWNQVIISFCSSDEWLGRGPNPEDTAGFMPSGETQRTAYQAPDRYVFNGATILDATMTLLRTTGVPIGRTGPLHVLQDTADNKILFGGSSAGAKGVMNNALRLEEQFTAAQRFYLVDGYHFSLDGGLPTSDETPELALKTVYNPAFSAACPDFACLGTARQHQEFEARNMKVMYTYALQDATIGTEGAAAGTSTTDCTSLAFPYAKTCTGAKGVGVKFMTAAVRNTATPVTQAYGWHPRATQHVLSKTNLWYFDTLIAPAGGVSFANVLGMMLDQQPRFSAVDN